MTSGAERRETIDAEGHTPELLRDFLVSLETTDSSQQVWNLIVALGRKTDLPMIDFISASSFTDWKKTRFIRTSYDSSWLHEINQDPDLHKWSYFRHHAMNRLTPITVGLEFIDDYTHLPQRRVEVLKMAAERGMRAGFSIPLRYNNPRQSGLITWMGDHSRRELLAILRAHGWTLHAAAVMAHQRYMLHFDREFTDRNRISPKQQDLLALIGLGLQDKVIADRVGISVSAVRQRMRTLMVRTHSSNRAELAALAISLGMVANPLHREDAVEEDTLVEMDNVGTRRR